jgi:hypothetical protein
MTRLLLSAAAAIAISSSAGAVDITGTYAVVGESHCVSGNVGMFNPAREIPSAAANITATSISGFAVFNSDGTGTTTTVITTVVNSAVLGEAWVDAGTVNSTFTYTVTGDEYTLTVTSHVETFTSGGPNAGFTNTVTGEPPLNGIASENSPHVLIDNNSTPTLETWTISNGIIQNAYCSLNRTLTKVKASDATAS